MSVVCEQPTIAEKLVPYVEGALAEPDRSEVLEHLRGCEACAGEVRLLKSSILSLRQAFTRASQYRPLTHIAPEDLERYAFEPETLTAEVLRGVKLHLAECGECEQEVSLLREMEQELAEKVEPVRAPDALPAALREAVARQFGTTTAAVAVAPRRPWMESLLAFLAGLSPKPLLAAGGACVVLFVGMQFVQHLPQTAPQSNGSQVAVTTTRESAATPAAPAAPAARTFGNSKEVALLPGRVDSNELPAFSRRLWDKQVSHSYRDGQIFVASEDVDKARKALQLVPREVAAVDLSLAKRAKGGPGPASLEAGRGGGAPAPAAEEVSADGEAAEQAPPADKRPTLADAKVTDAPSSRRESTVEPPSKPKENAAKAGYAASQPADARPAAPAKATSRSNSPAPVVVAKKAPATGTETLAVLAPKAAKGELANPRQQIARQPVQSQVAIAPKGMVLRGGDSDTIAQIPVRSSADEQVPTGPRPRSAPEQPPAPPKAQEAAVAAAQPPSAAEPASEGVREERERQGKDAQQLAARSTNSATAGVAPYTNVGTVGTVAPATTMSSGAGRAPGNRMDDGPVDSALLTQARRVALESVGESTVSLDKRDDGSVVVTVRSGRTLNSQEMDQLRKALRQKLNLADSDTVVIRQP